MKENKRMLLRDEYFGGIIHDIKGLNVEILDHKTYELISGLDSHDGREKALEAIKSDHQLESLIKKLQDKKAIGNNLIPIDISFFKHKLPSLPDRTLASPLRVYDTFGYGCNIECARCLAKCTREKLDLNRRTLDDTMTLMDKFYDAGTMEWRFTGGEPTAYDNFLNSVKYAKSLGMSVMFNTNACWKDSLYEPLLNSGVSEIIISIEGEKEINDILREKGVYDKIIRTINEINSFNKQNPEKKIGVTLNQTVGKQNVNSVEHVVMLAADNGFNINFVPARPYGRATCEDLLTTKEFMEFSRDVQRLREKIKSEGYTKTKVIHKNMDLFNMDMPDRSALPFPFNYSICGALSTGFGLSPDGRVNACSFLASDPRFVGKNLLEEGVTVYDVWLDPKMDRIRKAERVGCTNCDYYMQQCEGKCVAMVFANKGDIKDEKLIGKDRYCFRTEKEKLDNKP